MSDTIYKLIPCDYTFYPDDDKKVEGAVRLLKSYIKANTITWEKYDNPVFIDCGDNFDTVSCPFCEKSIEIDTWQEMMNKCFEESEFSNLNIVLPCCLKESTLNDLKYEMECGFAKLVIEVVNPEYPPCKHDLYEANKCFGKSVEFRMIVSHY